MIAQDLSAVCLFASGFIEFVLQTACFAAGFFLVGLFVEYLFARREIRKARRWD